MIPGRIGNRILWLLQGEEKATDNEPIPSNYMENLTATNVDADKSSPSSCDEDGSDTGGGRCSNFYCKRWVG